MKSRLSRSIIDNLIAARYAAKLINFSLLIAYGHTPVPARGAKCGVIVGVIAAEGDTRDVYTIVSFTIPGGPRRQRALRPRIFDKSRAARLRSRHPTPKFRRKAITNGHDDDDDDDNYDDDALSEEERTCDDTIAYIRYVSQFNNVMNDTTTTHYRAG